jgi:hypothetical protein
MPMLALKTKFVVSKAPIFELNDSGCTIKE